MDAQEADPESLLTFTRNMLTLRKTNPALRHGALAILVADTACLAFRRTSGDQSLLCIFNLSREAMDWPAGVDGSGRILSAVNGASSASLPPFAALLIEQ